MAVIGFGSVRKIDEVWVGGSGLFGVPCKGVHQSSCVCLVSDPTASCLLQPGASESMRLSYTFDTHFSGFPVYVSQEVANATCGSPAGGGRAAGLVRQLDQPLFPSVLPSAILSWSCA